MTESLVVRPARLQDADTLLAWRNDPWIVSLGTSQRPVTREEHRQWFQRMMDEEQHQLFIVEIDGKGQGTVRIDRLAPERAVITIYLLREFTGRGLGVRAIRTASDRAIQRWALSRIYAFIQPDNQASRSAFAKAGYAEKVPGMDCPPGHVEMVYTGDTIAGLQPMRPIPK